MTVIRALALFVAAGLCEIGGGYLVWQWLRESRGLLLGIVGFVILAAYGVFPTLQDEVRFGRVYAAYGAVFILMSMLWGWGVDRKQPDSYDIVGALVCLAGAALMMWAPRGAGG